MTRTMSRFAGRRARGDEGIAMVMVMGYITVLSLLMVAAVTLAINARPAARAEQDWNGALAAAQAGVDDYVGRLNADDNYYAQLDCTNVALKGPTTKPNSCGWNASTPLGWQKVQAGNPEAGEFHYEVDASRKDEEGGVRLTVTGRARGESRTLEVKVSRGGSTQFLYYTDFENGDPALFSVSSDTCGKSGPSKAKYWWNGRSSAGCSNEITFAAGDRLDGAVHFNDTPGMANGTYFGKGFESAAPSCKNGKSSNGWTDCTRTGKPTIPVGYAAKYAGPLYLPDNSDQLGTYPGCQYTGDTRIKFYENGTMRVWSKGSVGTSVGDGCGTPTNAGLGSAGGQLVNQPYNKVIYVKNKGNQKRCTTGQIVSSGGDVIPLAGDKQFDASTFYCGNGNVYVEGTVATRVTIGAQNNVVVTGDLLLQGVPAGAVPTGPHMVGLVAGNFIAIYHPVVDETYCTSWNWRNECTKTATREVNALPDANRYVYASIQALQHSFYVPLWNKGAQIGTLYVRGSIAQRFRGAVATTSGTGYLKDYSYDPRLKFNAPPYFPQYTNAVWSATVTGEIPPKH